MSIVKKFAVTLNGLTPSRPPLFRVTETVKICSRKNTLTFQNYGKLTPPLFFPFLFLLIEVIPQARFQVGLTGTLYARVGGKESKRKFSFIQKKYMHAPFLLLTYKN